MFRSAAVRESDLAERKFHAHMDHWKWTADKWFDGTVASVEERIAKLDNVIGFARDVVARRGSTGAGFLCVNALPNLEQSRCELAAARVSLLNGFSDRQAGGSALAGRRTATDLAELIEQARAQGRGGVTEHAFDPAAAAGGVTEHAFDPAAAGGGVTEHAFDPAAAAGGASALGPITEHPITAADARASGGYGSMPMTPGMADQVVGIGGGEGYQAPGPEAGSLTPPATSSPNPGNGTAGAGPSQDFGLPTASRHLAVEPAIGPYQDPGHGFTSDYLDQSYGEQTDMGRTLPTVSITNSVQRAIDLGSRDFLVGQNTDDRDELIIRARRYAADETSTLPTEAAHRIAAAFVGRVEELIARRPRKRHAAAQITHYEDFDDQLMY